METNFTDLTDEQLETLVTKSAQVASRQAPWYREYDRPAQTRLSDVLRSAGITAERTISGKERK